MNHWIYIFFILFASFSGFSQSTITGTITDQHSDTLSFVYVFLLEDTTMVHFTETDNNGFFKFEIPEDVSQLRVAASYLKFSTDTIVIGRKRIFNLYIDIPDNFKITIPPHEKYPIPKHE